jgi:hypothetical protein
MPACTDLRNRSEDAPATKCGLSPVAGASLLRDLGNPPKAQQSPARDQPNGSSTACGDSPGFIVCGRGTVCRDSPGFIVCGRGTVCGDSPGFIVCGRGTVCRDSPAEDRPPSVSPVPGASLPLGVDPRSARDRGTLRPCRHTLGQNRVSVECNGAIARGFEFPHLPVRIPTRRRGVRRQSLRCCAPGALRVPSSLSG